MHVRWRFGFVAACALLVATCVPPAKPDTDAAFRAWLASGKGRAEAFARFESRLRRAGVANVVANFRLWRVDRIEPKCVVTSFAQPPEQLWGNIIPALRFVRDHVEPAIGDVEVVSAYRSPQFNECIGGARASAHRGYYAIDLVPLDRKMTREMLIENLCRVHAREGTRAGVGLGIYGRRRFHIDARGFRGWGADHRRASFPCAAGKKGNTAS